MYLCAFQCVTEQYNKIIAINYSFHMFLRWFSLWLWHALIYLAVSGEGFFFFPQEALHFDLVRRDTTLFKFECYFCEEFGPFVYHVCYSGAENVYLSSHFEGRTDASRLLSAARFIFVSLCPPTPRLPALSLALFVSVVDERFYCFLNCDDKGFRIQNRFPLCSCRIQNSSHIGIVIFYHISECMCLTLGVGVSSLDSPSSLLAPLGGSL